MTMYSTMHALKILSSTTVPSGKLADSSRDILRDIVGARAQ
jgi:hypothetical protein